MSPQIIVALIIALCGFGSAWKIQDWRYGAKENERAQQDLADQRQSATAAIRRTETVIAAQSAATVRLSALQRDAAGARTALVSLSDATEQALRDAATSQAACLERAATLGELLNSMGKAGGELAEKAGRHASDVETLMGSWPK